MKNSIIPHRIAFFLEATHSYFGDLINLGLLILMESQTRNKDRYCSGK